MAEDSKILRATPVLAFTSLPIARQIILLAGLALAVSCGVAIFMWFQEPSYIVLYSSLAEKDAAKVMDSLTKSDIEFRIDQKSGAVMVPRDRIHQARIKLAMEGLPEGANMGFELLEKERGFGQSPLMESARYQRAMEGELSRSIASLKHVQSARVHLALPPQSMFPRKRKRPSASVLVELFPGRNLSDGQVAAIVHLIASSIPQMTPEDVTVVDQTGSLLTAQHGNKDWMRAAFEFDYVRKVEQNYVSRIEDILEPIIGDGGVRAQVVAEIDFSLTEQTQELYDPDLRALRNEQTLEEKSPGSGVISGVPGALSNQPPATGGLQPQAANGNTANDTRSSKKQNLNFDISRTISHTKLQSGTIKRLSVAVVIDDKIAIGKDGKSAATPLTPAELERMTALIKETVGYNEQRGDSVNVVNTSFKKPGEETPIPDPPFWESPWLREVLKILFGIITVVVFFYGFMRPVMRNLTSKAIIKAIPAATLDEDQGTTTDDKAALPGRKQQVNLPPMSEFDSKLNMAKNVVVQDPKRVAKVVKDWISEDE